MTSEMSPKEKMCSKETMIDTRPGTSTVGVQCSIWDRPPVAPVIESAMQEVNATVGVGRLKRSLSDASLDRGIDPDCRPNGSASRSSTNDTSHLDLGQQQMSLAAHQHLQGQLFNQSPVADIGESEGPLGNSLTQESSRAPKVYPGALGVQGKADVQQNSRRRCLSLDDESYEIMLDILSGRFFVPVKGRTRKQKAAVVRLWRNKGRYSLDSSTPPSLYFDGRRVLRRFEIAALMSACRETTGVQAQGARPIQQPPAGQAFEGISSRSAVRTVIKEEMDEKSDQRQFYV